MKTLSFQWSTDLKSEIRLRSIEPYAIECQFLSADFIAISEAVGQGIDSHLEAIGFKEFIGEYGRRGFMFDADTLHVLIRRLMESEDDNAQMLASGICETLGIELI